MTAASGTRWEVKWYRNANDRCPTEEFLDSLTPIEREYALRGLGRLKEHGRDLDTRYAHHLGGGIWELIVRIPNGQVRLFYFFLAEGRRIVVTHGTKKKQPKVRRADIDTAAGYRGDHLERHPKG